MAQARSNWMAAGILMLALSTAAFGDQSQTATLVAGSLLSFDNGRVSFSVGDILWNGTTLIPSGGVEVYNLGRYGARVFRSIGSRQASGAHFTSTAIPASSLVVKDIFGVHTKDRYAKVIVTSKNGDSLTLHYMMLPTPHDSQTSSKASGNAAAASPPQITGIANNSSGGYLIAQGSLFVIVGTNLSTVAPPVLQSSAPPGLPKTLNQTSVSVTVGKVTVSPGLYYTSATAIAAVLPSGTPTGSGVVTVTYNGQTSQAAPAYAAYIYVVPSAVGLTSLDGSGNFQGVATDLNGRLLGFTQSAMPGQTIVLWGTGIGADPNNDDLTYPQKADDLSTKNELQVLIGGIPAKVLYGGRSPYPGVDQYNLIIPPTATPGCFVSVIMQTNSVVSISFSDNGPTAISNTITLPISATGGACSDAATGLNGTQLQSLAGKNSKTVNSLFLGIDQEIKPDGSFASSALAGPATLPSSSFATGYGLVSQGSCIILPDTPYGYQSIVTNLVQPLDIGAVQLTSPSGSSSLDGFQTSLPAPFHLASGTYGLTGSGGAAFGGFSVSLDIGTPLTLTNTADLASITRSQGATVTWSGGYPNGDVLVSASAGGGGRLLCSAPSSAGQLVIPPALLLGTVPFGGPGFFAVRNTTSPQAISASGLDVGFAVGSVVARFNTNYK